MAFIGFVIAITDISISYCIPLNFVLFLIVNLKGTSQIAFKLELKEVPERNRVSERFAVILS